jgi:hypothetical protein
LRPLAASRHSEQKNGSPTFRVPVLFRTFRHHNVSTGMRIWQDSKNLLYGRPLGASNLGLY